MAEQQQPLDRDDQRQQTLEAPPDPSMEDMVACVDAMEAALLPCLTDMIEPKEPVPDYEAPLWTYMSEESLAKRDQAPAAEIKDTDDSPPPPDLQTNKEKHAREFMEAAQKLQRYFISLQRDDHQPTKADILRKEIDAMEEELKKKNELIEKHDRLIQGWKMELKTRLEEHNAELKKV